MSKKKIYEGSFGNNKDTEAVNSSLDGSNGGNFIKIEPGNNFVYLMTKKYKASYVHYISKRAFSCLGGFEGGGYAPNECPICKVASNFWQKKKNETNKKDKEFYNKCGNEIRAKIGFYTIAVKGFGVKEKVKGKIITTIGYEEPEAKFLRLTEHQFHLFSGRKGDKNRKEIVGLLDKYDFLESEDDFFNRALVFIKEGGDFGEVTIKPAKRKSSKPKIINDIPDLDEVIPSNDIKEMKKAIKEYMSEVGDEDEDDLDDIESEEEEIDDDIEEGDEDDIEEEEEQKNDKKSKKRSSKKEEKKEQDNEEDEEDEEDDLDDEDF